MVKSGIGFFRIGFFSIGFFKSAFVILNLGAALMLLLSAGPALAQGSPDFVAHCDGCTQQEHYAVAAARKVPELPSHVRTPLTWSVYVANVAHNHVEAFQVVVQPLDSGSGPRPEFPGIKSMFYEFGPYKTAWPVDGDPQVKAAVLEGISIAL